MFDGNFICRRKDNKRLKTCLDPFVDYQMPNQSRLEKQYWFDG